MEMARCPASAANTDAPLRRRTRGFASPAFTGFALCEVAYLGPRTTCGGRLIVSSPPVCLLLPIASKAANDVETMELAIVGMNDD